MRYFLAVIMLALVPCSAWAATITSAQSGNLSATSTWVGGVVPGAGDAAVIATGHTVVVDVNTTLGSKVAAVGHAVTIQATSNAVYGKLIVPSGVTLTLRGYDQTNNSCGTTNQYAVFEAQSGATVLLDVASYFAAHFINNGRFNVSGATISIPAANINYNNSSGARTWASTQPIFDPVAGINIMKTDTASLVHPGPISNAAGTGPGAFGDTSLVFTNGGTNGITIGQEVPTYSAITTTGQYYVDYGKGIVYFKNSGVVSGMAYTFKYTTWLPSGISSRANTAGSSISITGSTLNYLGSDGLSENIGAAIHTGYRSTLDADRGIAIQNNEFNHCGRTISVYDLIANASNRLVISGNTFNNSGYGTSLFDGVFSLGWAGYIDINGNTFDTFAPLFTAATRSGAGDLYVRNNTGRVLNQAMISTAFLPAYFDDNTFTGFAAVTDAGGFDKFGSASGSVYYRRNKITAGHRAARLAQYMIVQDNWFDRFGHHGAVHRAEDGYITGYTFTGNKITNSNADMAGGWTLGYNRKHWIDNVVVAQNTFDGSVRSIEFNDMEGTVVLGTRLQIYNNIAANSQHGPYRISDGSGNVTRLALSRFDYNNEYNNTLSNVKQGTPMKSGVEYNLNTRNCDGVSLHSPTYALPDATSRSLVQINSGTAPTNYSVTFAWGGGTPVQYVLSQGTATAGTTTTLTDSGKSWTTNAYQARYVRIMSGTGAGQIGMIISNTATVLTIIANTSNSAWTTAPDATSVYAIIESEAQLFDSGGTQSVKAGLYLPSVTLTAGTYTDSGITITTNALAANPQFNGSYAPTNAAIKTSGFGSTYIGAADVVSALGLSAVFGLGFGL